MHEITKCCAVISILMAAACSEQKAQGTSHTKEKTVTPMVEISSGLGTFEGQWTTEDGKKWQAVTDEGAGGVSSIEMTYGASGASGTKQSMHLKGTVKLKDFPFPFAGARVALGPIVDGQASSVNVTKFAGIQFWAKGDGKDYMVRMLDSRVNDFNFHHYVFKGTGEWKFHKVKFADVVQFDWGEKVAWTGTTLKGFMVTNYTPPGEEHGSMELQLDEIAFF